MIGLKRTRGTYSANQVQNKKHRVLFTCLFQHLTLVTRKNFAVSLAHVMLKFVLATGYWLCSYDAQLKRRSKFNSIKIKQQKSYFLNQTPRATQEVYYVPSVMKKNIYTFLDFINEFQ